MPRRLRVRKSGPWTRHVARARRRLAAGRPGEAAREYRRACRLADSKGADQAVRSALRQRLGLALLKAGRGRDALRALTEACELLAGVDAGAAVEQVEQYALTLDTLGLVRRDLGLLAAAEKSHREALKRLRQIGSQEDAVRVAVNLAVAVKDQGRITEARGLLEDILPAARRGDRPEPLGHVLLTLGLVHELLNNPDSAERLAREAAEAYAAAGNKESEAAATHNVGRALDAQGRHTEAIECFVVSLAINQEIGAELGVSDDLGALASLFQLTGEHGEARRLHERALAIQRRAGYRRAVVSTLSDLGLLARDEGDFPLARRHLQEALKEAETLADPHMVYEARVLLAETSMVEEDYERARVAYLAAAEAIGDARRALLDEADAVTFFSESRLDALDMLVRLSLHLHDRTGALEWADAARGQELVRRLALTALPAPPGPPEAILAEEARARHRLRVLEGDLRGGGSADAASLTAHRETLTVLRRLEDRLGEEAPEYVSMRRGERLGWNGIAALLAPAGANRPREEAELDDTPISPAAGSRSDGRAGETSPGVVSGPPGRLVLAEYYVTDHETFVFGVTADAPEPQVVTVEVTRAELRELAEEVRGTLSGERAGLGRLLADDRLVRLLAPVVQWAGPGDVVYLVPHDALHLLPLHAVPVGGGPLIDRNPVVLVPSASVLRYCQAKRRTRRETALIVADPPAEHPLAFAREQALAVSAEFGGQGVPAAAQATREALIARLAEPGGAPDVIHFATHGVFDPMEPMRSGIELAGGRLTAEDILGLRLDVDLVTLAACETGVSERRPGDELIGLTRALLYAGAPSALVALWRVDELSTSMLFGRFYAALRAGASKAEALRQAQLWLRDRTIADALEYARGARSRLAGDPRALAVVRLEEARLHLAAGYFPAAAGLFGNLVDHPELDEEQREVAEVGMLQARLAMDVGGEPNLNVPAFADPYHWAPFELIGDWL
ncbi:CHAT domain-containing protein [Microbispora triticiradicis]|uniref:CHAT domain-containing protein n=1 Tax=Microbispora triticiradicis TaxID=2200763 RepID=A0ABX9LB78_9ACTN|nr:CHAT domain-containing protein [Microbispora triticiradicis]RGA01223.1 CHAT domain-containing protein [Microbispora triticiradicis]